MSQEHEARQPDTGTSEPSRMPEMRADHIPDDVLAEQDAETRAIGPEADPLVHLSGAPDDLLTEEELEARAATSGALTPTDSEILDLVPDDSELA